MTLNFANPAYPTVAAHTHFWCRHGHILPSDQERTGSQRRHVLPDAQQKKFRSDSTRFRDRRMSHRVQSRGTNILANDLCWYTHRVCCCHMYTIPLSHSTSADFLTSWFCGHLTLCSHVFPRVCAIYATERLGRRRVRYGVLPFSNYRGRFFIPPAAFKQTLAVRRSRQSNKVLSSRVLLRCR